ncbi:hypothetical protein CC80DRAFT_559028 [Byssothecium circinans]|uniref:Ankyrin n=1 Tax=Byssothecium circinans TaxID=147558 RepID=A0A6A5TZZ2_9PLEO|nr:hypothetical protein CC80DRAFT_559028 [Byssothecium circinans]
MWRALILTNCDLYANESSFSAPYSFSLPDEQVGSWRTRLISTLVGHRDCCREPQLFLVKPFERRPRIAASRRKTQRSVAHFPVETFSQIIHELVTEAGIIESWKLRSVCRTFAAEIHHDIFAYQSKERIAEVGNDEKHKKIVSENLGIYLLNRLRNPLDVDIGFLNLLRELIGFLAKETHFSSLEDRQAVTVQFCDGIAKFSDLKEILSQICSGNVDSPVKPEDQIAAAMCTGNITLAHTLSSSLSELKYESTFGKILNVAVRLRNTSIVQMVLEKQKQDHRSTFSSEFVEAIDISVSLQHVDILDILIQHYPLYARSTKRGPYMSWIMSAIRSGSLEVLQSILSIWNVPNYKLSIRNRELAFKYSSLQIVKLLLGHRTMVVDGWSSPGSVLISAIKSRRSSVVKAVLKTGAEADPEMWDRKKNARKRKSWNTERPLIFALMRQGTRIVKLLLTSGATMPSINQWPLKPKMWSYLRNLSIELGTDVPTLEDYRAEQESSDDGNHQSLDEASETLDAGVWTGYGYV